MMIDLASVMPAERPCCGTFAGSRHRATCTPQGRAVALMAQDDPDPAIAQAAQDRADERRELMRRAKYSYLCWAQDNPEADPAEIAEARAYLEANPPLRRALGTGEPA